MKKAIWVALVYVLGVFLFLLCGTILVMFAAGYRINYQEKNVFLTSILEVSTEPPDTQIYLNNDFQGSGRVTLRGIDPGTYEITVKAKEYHEWRKKVELRPGEAQIIDGIVLFKTNPKICDAAAEFSTINILKLANTNNLASAGGEIMLNGNTVTRYFDDVQGVCWYPDSRHIAFTQNGKLKIIDLDGSNEVGLVDKDSGSPVLFINSGQTAVYENQGKIYQATIR